MGLHFCSMRITEDVRRYAAEQGVPETEAIEQGMAREAKDSVAAGADVYREV